MPGPLVVVAASEPPKEAPMALVMPAISFSAWNVLIRKFLYFANSCSISLAGVIGYESKNNSSLAFTDAAIKPQAVASLPVILHT